MVQKMFKMEIQFPLQHATRRGQLETLGALGKTRLKRHHETLC